MRYNQILCYVKMPGEAPYWELIDNTLQSFQNAVDGYIETVTVAEDLCLIVNEEGRLWSMPYNISVLGLDLYGPVLAVGVDGDEFTDIKAAQMALAARLLGGYDNE